MISGSLRWPGIVLALWLTCLCGTVDAQTLNVSLSSSGAQSLTAGSTFSNGGTVTVTATGVASGQTVTISGLTLSISNPGVFSSLTINASAPSGSESDEVSLNTGDNSVSLSSITLSNEQSATFVLTGTVSSTPAAGDGFSWLHLKNFRQASLFPTPPALSLSMVYLALAALGLLAMSGRLRRRHLAMFAVWLLMAAGVLSCGMGGSASSDQQVTALTATSSSGSTVNMSGAPVDLGTISVEDDTTTTIAEPTPT